MTREKFSTDDQQPAAGNSFDAPGMLEHQPQGYRAPEEYTVNGLRVTAEQLGRLEIPQLMRDPVVEEFSAQERGTLGELLVDTAAMAHAAQQEGASPEAREYALANAFLTCPVPSEEAAQKVQMAQARKIVAEHKGESAFSRWMETDGKRLLRVITLAVGFGAAVPASAGGWSDLLSGFGNEGVVQTVLQKVERGMQGKQQLDNINQREAQIQLEIQRIDAEKAMLGQYSSTNVGVAGVENPAEHRANISQAEADYRMQKAQVLQQREQVAAQFKSLPNPSPGQKAQYEAQLAQLDAQDVRIDQNYAVQRAREGGRVGVRAGQIEMEAGNASAQIEQYGLRQAQLRQELQQLQVQKARVIADTAGDIGRYGR